MTNDKPGGSWGSYCLTFARWLLAFSLFAIVVTGAVLYFKTSGPDTVVLQDPYWGLAKWYFLDIHVVFAFLAVLLGGLWGAAVVLKRPHPAALPRGRRIAVSVAAVVIGILIARWVVDQHPILVDTIRATAYPSSRIPDEITLTWQGDPKTTQSVQWRTSPDAGDGQVRVRPSAQPDAPWTLVAAEHAASVAERLANDRANWWHTARLTGLSPGTAYTYQVGQGDYWTSERGFRTAPAGDEPFSFLYLGDSQEGLLDYGHLTELAVERHPEVAFIVLAGDLVNRGCDRDDWDLFFHASRNVFDRYTLVPVIGNHDDCGVTDPRLYTGFFDLPTDGSDALSPEQTYSFQYSNASLVVLNSNLAAGEQAPYLDTELAKSTATWKFTSWHHPAYASKPNRDEPEVQENWIPLIDKHKVDIVLQGHDHAYMRTYPMRGGKIVDSPADGTVYLVAVSGTKYYDQVARDYIAKGFEDVSTYQVIRIDGAKLRYEAYNMAGELVDELDIDKE